MPKAHRRRLSFQDPVVAGIGNEDGPPDAHRHSFRAGKGETRHSHHPEIACGTGCNDESLISVRDVEISQCIDRHAFGLDQAGGEIRRSHAARRHLHDPDIAGVYDIEVPREVERQAEWLGQGRAQAADAQHRG